MVAILVRVGKGYKDGASQHHVTRGSQYTLPFCLQLNEHHPQRACSSMSGHGNGPVIELSGAGPHATQPAGSPDDIAVDVAQNPSWVRCHIL